MILTIDPPRNTSTAGPTVGEGELRI